MADFVTKRKSATDQFLQQTLSPVQQILDDRERAPGEVLRQRYGSEIEKIKEGVSDGRYRNLQAAQTQLSSLAENVQRFANLVDKFTEVPPENKALAEKRMNTATTLPELRQILLDAGAPNVPGPLPGKSFGVQEEGAGDTGALLGLSLKRRLQISLGATAIAFLTYLFVLVVGWISLYVKNDTFGSDPMSYVSLFLWGATIEAVRGKTVNLTALKTIPEGRS